MNIFWSSSTASTPGWNTWLTCLFWLLKFKLLQNLNTSLPEDFEISNTRTSNWQLSLRECYYLCVLKINDAASFGSYFNRKQRQLYCSYHSVSYIFINAGQQSSVSTISCQDATFTVGNIASPSCQIKSTTAQTVTKSERKYCLLLALVSLTVPIAMTATVEVLWTSLKLNLGPKGF